MRYTLVASIAMIMMLTVFTSTASGQENDDIIETAFYGTVYDNETMEPIEGATVFCYDEQFRISDSNRTDAEGNYRLEFKRGGSYHIFTEAEGYEQNHLRETIEIDTEEQVDIFLIPVDMGEGESLIYGTVSDESTGQPLRGAEVRINKILGSDQGQYYEIVDLIITEEDGYFSTIVTSGDYFIRVYLEGYQTHHGESFYLEPDVEFNYDIEMERWNNGVFGTVTNEDGEILSDVVVTLENDWYRGTDTTDDNGDYEIRAPQEGFFTLSCHEDGYRPHREDVGLDGEMEEIDIEMTRSVIPDPILRFIYLILSLIT